MIFTQQAALQYVANMYSGTEKSDYWKTGKNWNVLSVKYIMTHMESIYIAPHEKRLAGEDLAKLRIKESEPSAKGMKEFEDIFFKLRMPPKKLIN